jgi:alpha-galactosidase
MQLSVTLALLLLPPAAVALDNGVGLVPAAGWSSWNVFGGGVTAEAVMGMADVMVAKGLDKLGFVYVGIDCGWDLRERAANGDLQPNPKKFPKVAACAVVLCYCL